MRGGRGGDGLRYPPFGRSPGRRGPSRVPVRSTSGWATNARSARQASTSPASADRQAASSITVNPYDIIGPESNEEVAPDWP